MKKFISLIIFLILATSFFPLRAQKLIKNSTVTGVCYAGNKVNRIYIPPPQKFLKKAGSKGGGKITVYYAGFSTQAIRAIDMAKSILESMLPADARFTISAVWNNKLSSRVLGNTSITGYLRGWDIDAQNPKAVYPVALAEKILGEDINDPSQGDMILNINSSIPWYYGTDGNPSNQQFDLITVVLHEVCHGLGFYSDMYSDGTIGGYGFGAVLPSNDSIIMPFIFDTFIENFRGKKLIDTLEFKDPSPELGNELVSEKLFFKGPLLLSYPPFLKAKLYAPPVFDAGSSMSHLDDKATLPENSLMKPSIDLGEAIHDPGQYTFSILGDIGWINTRISHKPGHDTEEHLTEIPLSITVKSDTLYNRDRVGVVYSFDNFLSSDTLFLVSPGSNDQFSTTINIPSYNTDLQYYFFVEDTFLRLYRSPSLFDMLHYSVYVGQDTVKPIIVHNPAGHYLETVDSIAFKAVAVDNIGVDSVFIEYKVNDRQTKYFGLKAGLNNTYSALLNVKPELLKGGDSIQYRIFAIDSALIPNTAVLPKTGYFVIHFEDISSTLHSYSTDFSNAVPDFFNVGFDISKPTGFGRFGLNTKHPYESSGDNSLTIESTALLRHPIKLDESGMLITYNEIVLVEPGETGSVFGDNSFFDYVIVEGSKNFGKTWFGLEAGYDSRYDPSWETAYNSSIVNDNSTFVPTESMLKKHTIFFSPSDKVSAGDTLLIRFRLYSDPLANGWGWVVEDLKIGPLIDAVEKVSYDPVKVFPNPGNGLINIRPVTTGNMVLKPTPYKIYNSSGICIISGKVSGDSGTLVDISAYPTGIYIIVLYSDDGLKRIKYSLIK